MRPGGVGGERLAQNKRKAGCETGEGGKKERGKKKKMVGLLQFQGRMGGGEMLWETMVPRVSGLFPQSLLIIH